MKTDIVAKASTSIIAPIGEVWDALVNPEKIKQYMFGTEVVSDWKEGSPIIWKGVWKENPYEDKGVILKIKPGQYLQYTHYSPLTGKPDVPENYHTVTFDLAQEEGHTLVLLSQDNNATETDREHSEEMWKAMLESLKKLLEIKPGASEQVISMQ